MRNSWRAQRRHKITKSTTFPSETLESDFVDNTIYVSSTRQLQGESVEAACTKITG